MKTSTVLNTAVIHIQSVTLRWLSDYYSWNERCGEENTWPEQIDLEIDKNLDMSIIIYDE